MKLKFIYGAGDDFIARAHKIRHTVFVLEQDVAPELEWDDKDGIAIHFIGLDEQADSDVATGRLLIDGAIAKFQRIAVIQSARGQNIGHDLMLAMLDYAINQGIKEAHLDAQVQAIPFYEKLGFKACGPVFDDAGIPHRHMKRDFDFSSR